MTHRRTELIISAAEETRSRARIEAALKYPRRRRHGASATGVSYNMVLIVWTVDFAPGVELVRAGIEGDMQRRVCRGGRARARGGPGGRGRGGARVEQIKKFGASSRGDWLWGGGRSDPDDGAQAGPTHLRARSRGAIGLRREPRPVGGAAPPLAVAEWGGALAHTRVARMQTQQRPPRGGAEGAARCQVVAALKEADAGLVVAATGGAHWPRSSSPAWTISSPQCWHHRGRARIAMSSGSGGAKFAASAAVVRVC